MSYGLGIYFKEVRSKEEAFEYAMKFTECVKEHAQEKIESAKYFIPSMESIFRITEKTDEIRDLAKQTDEMWLWNTFTSHFIYWEKHNLLGVIEMRYPKACMDLFPAYVYFQNSTDQDYDINRWGTEITVFNEVIKEVMEMSKEELYDYNVKNFWTYESEEELDENYATRMKEFDNKDNYYSRSTIYKKIFDALDLDTVMNDNEKSDNFIRFNLCAINGSDDLFKLKMILKFVKRILAEEDSEEEKDNG